jgi:hypothetical protein
MPRFRKYQPSGQHGRLRGVKLPRRRKFEAALMTSSGIKVRSSYERTCADLLTANDVEFQYEPLMLIGGKQFRPDFYLPAQNLFIEICGYNHMPHYRDRIAHKKRLYDANNLQALFIDYNGRGSLTEVLIERFAASGLKLQNLKNKKKPGLSSPAMDSPGFPD